MPDNPYVVGIARLGGTAGTGGRHHRSWGLRRGRPRLPPSHRRPARHVSRLATMNRMHPPSRRARRRDTRRSRRDADPAGCAV